MPLTVPPVIWNVPIDFGLAADIQRAAVDGIGTGGSAAAAVIQRAGEDLKPPLYPPQFASRERQFAGAVFQQLSNPVLPET